MIRRIFITFIALSVLSASLNADTPAANLTKKPDSWFRSDEGRKAMECILSWQSEHGDWPKNKNTTREEFSGDRSKLKGTFDNGATTGELRVLARAFRVTGDTRYEKAFLTGFDHILEAQYPNGGWPQYYPLREGYYSHITFNDGSMIRLMEFLRDTTTSEDFAFLDKDRRAAATKALDRGIDCIVKCQVIVNGTPTVWCAQHDEVTLAPANARSYELASLSGAESAGVLKFLMSLDNTDSRSHSRRQSWCGVVRIGKNRRISLQEKQQRTQPYQGSLRCHRSGQGSMKSNRTVRSSAIGTAWPNTISRKSVTNAGRATHGMATGATASPRPMPSGPIADSTIPPRTEAMKLTSVIPRRYNLRSIRCCVSHRNRLSVHYEGHEHVEPHRRRSRTKAPSHSSVVSSIGLPA